MFLVKDLVMDMTNFYSHKSIEPWLQRKNSHRRALRRHSTRDSGEPTREFFDVDRRSKSQLCELWESPRPKERKGTPLLPRSRRMPEERHRSTPRAVFVSFPGRTNPLGYTCTRTIKKTMRRL